MFRSPVKKFQSILKNVQPKTTQANKYQTSGEKALPAQADVVIIGELQNYLNKEDRSITFIRFYSLCLLKRWRSSRLLYTLPFDQAWHSGCLVGKIPTHIRNNMVLSTLSLYWNYRRKEVFSLVEHSFQAYKWLDVEDTSKWQRYSVNVCFFKLKITTIDLTTIAVVSLE